MKIGIYTTALNTPFKCGTRAYAEQLILRLSMVGAMNEYVIVLPRRVKLFWKNNVKLVDFPKFPPLFRSQLLLGRIATSEKVNIFHYLEPYGSIFFRGDNIVTTIHDINLNRVYPKDRGIIFFVKRWHTEITRFFVIKYTHHFIVDSKFVANELRRYLKHNKLEKKKITVIPLAPSAYFKNQKVERQKIILCMGDFSPRKNTISVIRSYVLLPVETRRLYRLHFVVSSAQELPRFKQMVKEHGISEFVKFEVSITDRRLCRLYNQATLFVYPSLYEGFGLPILEAMACGCPVITSKFGAMRETAGNAAVLVDPVNIKEISDSILEVIQDKVKRKKLIRLGLDRVKRFTWDKTATETLKVYRSVVESKRLLV